MKLKPGCGRPKGDKTGTFQPPVCHSVEIVMPNKGSSIRTIITGRKVIGSGAFSSKKDSCSHVFEGETERLLTLSDEVSTGTLRSFTQPFAVVATTSAGVLRSIPDKARLLSDFTWEIVEAKREWASFSKPAAQQQAWLGQLAADALGARYRQVVHAHFDQPVLRHNLELVAQDRFVNVTSFQERAARRILASSGPMPLWALLPHLGPCPITARACVHALMVRRVLTIDLAERLSERSLVSAVPPLPGPLPDLLAHVRAPANAAFADDVAA